MYHLFSSTSLSTMTTNDSQVDSPHKSFRAHNQFSVTQGITDNRDELRFNMHRKITCIPYEKFMEEFFPEWAQSSSSSFLSLLPAIPNPWGSKSSGKLASSTSRTRVATSNKTMPRKSRAFTRNPFSGMSDPKSEVDMYDKIVSSLKPWCNVCYNYYMQTSALNKTKICDGYTFVPTPHKADTTDKSRQAVDCGMYPNSALDNLDMTADDKFGRTNWSLVEIAIECKMEATAGDPFDGTIDTDEPVAVSRRKVLGQILSYAEFVFQRQHRTCQYMLLFLGKFARIVRIDRAGIFATGKFSYRKEGTKLAKFLHYYTSRSAADRGHDITAERLDPNSDDAERMRTRVKRLKADDYVGLQFKASLDEAWPWWRLEVTDERDKNKKHGFFVGKPHFQASGVAGRTTRGYIAISAEVKNNKFVNNKFVYLKDAWRVVSDNIDKEGAVLEVLRQHKVEHVPTPICHGDIPGQETKTQAVWPKYHDGEKCHLKHHQHYRLVVKEVGKPLEEFSNGFQLFTAILCAVTGEFRPHIVCDCMLTFYHRSPSALASL